MPFPTVSDLGGLTCEEALDPPLRRLNYGDESAVVTMSFLLRYCWGLQPPDSKDGRESVEQESSGQEQEGFLLAKDVYAFLSPLSHMSDEEKASLPRDTDKDDWRSEWRQQIAYVWRHVFSDCWDFWYAVNPSVGIWTLKRTEDEVAKYGHGMGSFAVFYSDISPGPGEMAMIKKWSATSVALLPMFLDDGVQISFDRTEPGDAIAHLHTWDDPTCCDVLYLRQDVEIAITVEPMVDTEEVQEDREHEDKKGIAAVFVYATFIRDRLEDRVLPIQEEQ